MSRLNGVASTMLYGLALDLNMAKPSWCFDVMTMYFMPASFASCTHASASNLTGLKREASRSYSLTGTAERSITHSPRPGERLPFHSPAGMA